MTPAAIQQPRPFGYVLGDVLTQRVLLQSQGHDFDPAQLPGAERAGLWLWRRSAAVMRDNMNHKWLILDYQIINAPQQLMTVSLPALTLKSKAKGADSLFVPEWPISVAPLTPRIAFAKGGLQDLRPDHPAPTLPTAGLWRQLEIWSTALIATLAAWFGWWLIRYIRAAASQPFARALREIRRAGGDSQEAWLALHRAFDRTAGRALQINTLNVLFQRAPYLEPQRPEIERFYAESTWRFFGAGGEVNKRGVRPAGADLRALADGTRPTSDSGSLADGTRPTSDSGSLADGTRPTADPGALADGMHAKDQAASLSLPSLCTTLRSIEKQHER
jgi:mxaA protein